MFSVAAYNQSIKNVPQLGIQIFWSLHQNRYLKDAVKTAFEKANINSKDYLQFETANTNFKNAVEKVAKEYNYQPVKIKEDGEYIIYRLIKLIIEDEAEKVNLNQDIKISLRKKDKSIYGEGDIEVIDKVKEVYEYYLKTVPDGKLRQTFVRLLRNEGGAVNLRPSGGIYFVPRQNTAVIEKLDILTNELNLGEIYPMGIVDGKAERKAAATFVEEDLKARLVEIKRIALERENVRIKTIINAQNETTTVQELYKMYQELLEGEEIAEEIQNMCQELQGKLSEKIIELDKEKK